MNASPAPPALRLRAPKGGAVSPVNGRWYRGGCFMPTPTVAAVKDAARSRWVRSAAASAQLHADDLLGAGWIAMMSGRRADGAMARAARADRMGAGPRRAPLARSWGFPLQSLAAAGGTLDPADLDAMLHAVGKLGGRERAVVESRFGLDGQGGASQAEAGRRLGISQATVSRAEAAAMRRLRSALGAGSGVARA